MEKNRQILDWLFGMANDPFLKYGKYSQHVKAMAAAVGYQLSLNLLNDLMVFCKEIDVYLPLAGKTIRSNGLTAAYFWVNKDIKRLENLRFPEIRAFVEEIVRWENSNLKYSDIANNKTEFKKLDEGYLKIRRFSEIGLDLFGDIKFGLNKTLSIFGSVGSNLILVTNIKKQLRKAKSVVAEEHKAVTAVGGLHILGTERHESRRIDNQLRGRAGRQGDPGSSRFVLSLEDDLMRIFAGDKVRSTMEWLGMEKGVAIESRTVSKQIERAQKAVEARNFETRKHVLKYDDVMNRQRETIYSLRRQLMFEPEHREYLLGETGVARDMLSDLTGSFLSSSLTPDQWDVDTYDFKMEEFEKAKEILYPIIQSYKQGDNRLDLKIEALMFYFSAFFCQLSHSPKLYDSFHSEFSVFYDSLRKRHSH